MNHKWMRVSKRVPCPICEHIDWCCIGELYVNCMRVVSSKPCSNGGYLHPLNGQSVSIPRQEPTPEPSIDAPGMMNRWLAETSRVQYDSLASKLGVSATALLSLQCAWASEHRAWAFPMRNGAGAVVGIRLRADSGRKWAVTGGHEGVFVPITTPFGTAYLPEGPTSLAAILTLGKFGIGRPNNSGGIAHMAATLARLKITRAVILADNEGDKMRPNGDRWNPGLDGGKRLAEEIGVQCCVLVLPCKDAREFVSMGGTSELLDSLTQSLVWHQPKGERITEILPRILPTSKNVSRKFTSNKV